MSKNYLSKPLDKHRIDQEVFCRNIAKLSRKVEVCTFKNAPVMGLQQSEITNLKIQRL